MPAVVRRLLDRVVYRITCLLVGGSPRTLALLTLVVGGGRPIRRDGSTLDPSLQLLLALHRRVRTEGYSHLSPARARQHARREAQALRGRIEPVHRVRNLTVPGGASPLPARLYMPEPSGEAAPLLLFFHGGGFVIGDLETHDTACRLLCRHAGVNVLAVEYRLSPENPYPAALEDAEAVTAWAVVNAGRLGADPARIVIGGDSAGGNLAAVMSQRDRSRRRLAAQLLMYPAVDTTLTRPSMTQFADGFFLTSTDIGWFVAAYQGEPPRVDPGDPAVSPLRATDMSHLAPAIVVTAGFDPLRDEGDAYAAALRAAGTPTIHLRMRSLIHGFINMTSLNATCRDSVIEIAGALSALLETLPRDLPVGATVTSGEMRHPVR